MTEQTRPLPLYGLHGVPCVVCGHPAAGVVRTDHGTATAHQTDQVGQRFRICPHPPTGDTPHGDH